MTLKCSLLAAALGLAPAAFAQTGTIRRIVLERTPCFGTCPDYRLTLNADGTAEYVGGRFAPRQGSYKGTYYGGLDRLAPVLDRLGYWRLKPAYAARATDQPSHIVTVVASGGTKTVREEGSDGPAELFALQSMIDGLAANVRWTKAAPQGGEAVPPTNIGDGSPIAFTRWKGERRGTGTLTRVGRTTKLASVSIELKPDGTMTLLPGGGQKALTGRWKRKDGKTVALTAPGGATGSLLFMDRANPYRLTLRGKALALDFRVSE